MYFSLVVGHPVHHNTAAQNYLKLNKCMHQITKIQDPMCIWQQYNYAHYTTLTNTFQSLHCMDAYLCTPIPLNKDTV